MKKSIDIELFDKILIKGSIFYLILPILLFIFFWLDEKVAPFMLFFLSFCGFRMDRSIAFRKGEYQITKRNLLSLLVVISLLIVWFYFSGIGRFVYQNYDHRYKNAIFQDLMTYQWPVHFHDAVYNKPAMLCYYFFFWLPPALLGKAAGPFRANIILFLWSLIGLALGYGLFVRLRKKISILETLLFIFFSGLDIIGFLLLHKSFPDFGLHLETWIPQIQVSSITTQFYWSFNQFIPVLIGTFLLLSIDRKKNYIAIFSLLFPYSPYAVITLIPLVLLWTVSENYGLESRFSFNFKQIGSKFRNAINIENVLTPLLIMVVFIPFFLINSKRVPIETAKNWIPIKEYLLAILLEFLIYFLIMIPKFKSNISGWCIVTVLCIIPIFCTTDLNMILRGTAPLVLILLMMVLDFLSEKRYLRRRILLICLLLIGAWTPSSEIYRIIEATIHHAENQEVLTFSNNEYTPESGSVGILTYVSPAQYLSYEEDYQDSFFYRYLMIR